MIFFDRPIISQSPEMVSKIIKRTPPRSIKRHSLNHHRSKTSPTKTNASFSVIASLNKSIKTCRRRLARLFSKLAHVATPSTTKRRHKGYKILKQEELDEFESNFVVPRALVFDQCLLPPLICESKKTIFLDLDETLVHSSPDPPPKMYDFVVRPSIDGQIMNFYVLKRPGVDFFLEEISKKYEVVVFTAGLKQYASQVLDKLDPKGFISYRFYRDSCKEVGGKFVKDLSEMGRDLGKVVIVDDNPNAYSLQPENAVPIRPFVEDGRDRELEKLVKFFEWCERLEDMRAAVKQYFSGSNGGSSVVADDYGFVQLKQ
ncbi:carboxy-terminal domain RNA polymerase II polypeptide A small phosphatase 1 [Durio zibethinus]|uniref:Carboxy-terminal domain RNA polymerase II polypeptide A small phosphatase 1 n=1 Tax=Durio zibethinus TaxID=66656 RepID=A0A6P5XAR0_DURZI|nr:carboxy-terminal domain RNA polymerase II polypeptide A small phosphatase 1 [Durio zibethinus]